MAEQEMRDIPTLTEIVVLARRNLDDGVWVMVTGGAETETTLLRNRQSLDEIAFRTRVLRDVRSVDTAATFLGLPQRIPVMLAPVGTIGQIDQAGALAAARAGAAFGVTTFVSSTADPGIETVRQGTDAPLIFQLYVRGDDDWLRAQLDQIVELGYAALCVTVDTPTGSRNIEPRRLDPSASLATPQGSPQTGMEFQAAFSWKQIEILGEKSTIPLIIKGITTAEDAKIAAAHGVAAIYISNHGGRQLDHCPGTIELIPEIIGAVGDQAEVIVDGGFMRGTDVVKAIALGAKSVAIGKLYLYGLAAGGEAGVVRVLELLEAEIRNNMGLLGVTSLDQLDPSYLRAANPVRPPGPFSALPLVDFPEIES